MSQSVAISSKDRIIITADGKSQDTVTKIISLDVPKIFALTDNVAATVVGMGIENLEKFMFDASFNIKYSQKVLQKLISFEDIVDYMQALIEQRIWAENDKSFMNMIVVGYIGNLPQVRALGTDENNMHKQNLSRLPRGSWDGADKYLIKKLKDKKPDKIEASVAEKVAIRLILKAEKAVPIEIGGKQMLWHIYPDNVDPKTSDYIDKLREKYS